MAEAQLQSEPKAPTKPKTVKVLFQNLKDRDSKENVLPLEFTFQGERIVLQSGQTYDLLPDLVAWLQSRTYPIYDYVPNPDDPQGSKICAKVGEDPRFSVIPLG